MQLRSVLLSVAQCHLMESWNQASWNQRAMLSWLWPLLYAPAREVVLTLMGELSSWTQKRRSHPSTLTGKSWPSCMGLGELALPLTWRLQDPVVWTHQLNYEPGLRLGLTQTRPSAARTGMTSWLQVEAQTTQIRKALVGAWLLDTNKLQLQLQVSVPRTNSGRRNLIPGLVLWHPPECLGMHIAPTSCIYTYNNNKNFNQDQLKEKNN